MRLSRVAVSPALFVLVLSGCTGSKTGPFPEHPGYLLVGRAINRVAETNKLVVFDADTLSVWREVKLPPSEAYEMAIDPLGRIWIGFNGDFDRFDDRVMIYSHDGDLIETIEPCIKPESGAAFAGEQAFIACADRGFHAVVAAVDLESLEVAQRVEVSDPDPTREGWRLCAMGANEQAVVLALHEDRIIGPEASPSPANALVVLDPTNLEERYRFSLDFAAHIEQIRPLPDGSGRFLLLNNNWARIKYPDSPANDPEVMLFDPATGQVEYIHDQPLPARATFTPDGGLYVLHKDTTGPIDFQPGHLTRFEGLTPVQEWSLPNWFFTDVAVCQGQIYLVNESRPDPDLAGLYQLDPETGELERKLHVPYAFRILIPQEPGEPSA